MAAATVAHPFAVPDVFHERADGDQAQHAPLASNKLIMQSPPGEADAAAPGTGSSVPAMLRAAPPSALASMSPSASPRSDKSTEGKNLWTPRKGLMEHNLSVTWADGISKQPNGNGALPPALALAPALTQSITKIPSPFGHLSSKDLESMNDLFGEEGQVSRAASSLGPSREGSVAGLHGASRASLLLQFGSNTDRPAVLHPEEPRSSRALWRGAVRAVRRMSDVSRQFHTLRDMHGNHLLVSRDAIKVINVLGKGAFALVERCVYRPPRGGRPRLVAVKRLKPDLTRDPDDLRDLIQEVGLLRRLRHKHIVAFIGYGYWEFRASAAAMQGSLFIVEELVEGGSLKALVCNQMKDDTHWHYGTADALRWLRQVALGLAYLHRSLPQVIHRDLKLDNVLLSSHDPSRSDAKIADFGLSALVRCTSTYNNLQQQWRNEKSYDGDRTSKEMDKAWSDAAQARCAAKAQVVPLGTAPSRYVSHSNASVVGVPRSKQPAPGIMTLDVATGYDQLSGRTGTLMYMAPEVYRQEPYNEKADVFSFAMIAYELVHRFMMIRATNGSRAECQAYARRVSYGYRPPISPRVPEPLAALIMSCWHQDASRRPDMATVADQVADLERTLDFQALDLVLLRSTPTTINLAPPSLQEKKRASQASAGASTGCGCVVS